MALKMRLNRQQRDEIVAEIRKVSNHLFQKHIADSLPAWHVGGNCLWAATTTVALLNRRGIRALLQAGSASWPRLTEAQDDGKDTTLSHYSYMWDFVEAFPSLRRGEMPELHAWAIIPGPPGMTEVIDVTTGEQPLLCHKSTGLNWPGDLPPDYLWCTETTFPDRWRYEAHPHACEVVMSFYESIATGKPLVIKFKKLEDLL